MAKSLLNFGCRREHILRQKDRLDYLSGKWSETRPELDIRPWQIWGRITRIHELFLAAIAPGLSMHELNFKEFQTLAALILSGPPYEASPNQIAKFNLLTSGGVANLLARTRVFAGRTMRICPSRPVGQSRARAPSARRCSRMLGKSGEPSPPRRPACEHAGPPRSFVRRFRALSGCLRQHNVGG